jgi:hypothetical protein
MFGHVHDIPDGEFVVNGEFEPAYLDAWKEKRGLVVELLQVMGEFLIAFVAGLCEYIDCWIVVQMLFLRLTVALGACVVQIS